MKLYDLYLSTSSLIYPGLFVLQHFSLLREIRRSFSFLNTRSLMHLPPFRFLGWVKMNICFFVCANKAACFPLRRKTPCSCPWRSAPWWAMAAFSGTANVDETLTRPTSSCGERPGDSKGLVVHESALYIIIIIIIIKLYLYSTFHTTHALQNDISQVQNRQQEIPLRLFVKNFTGTCSKL